MTDHVLWAKIQWDVTPGEEAELRGTRWQGGRVIREKDYLRAEHEGSLDWGRRLAEPIPPRRAQRSSGRWWPRCWACAGQGGVIHVERGRRPAQELSTISASTAAFKLNGGYHMVAVVATFAPDGSSSGRLPLMR